MYLIDPDSVVVGAAAERLRAHQPVSTDEQRCRSCGEPAPCRIAADARQIQSAATLVEAWA